MTVRETARKICKKPQLSKFNEKQRVHLSWNLAVEIHSGSLKEADIEHRLKEIPIPNFDQPDIVEVDVESLPINKKIEHYYNKGDSTREIMKKVGKTYTRVKNIIKKIRDEK
jgi:hypothetical protein